MTAERKAGKVPKEILDYFKSKGLKPSFDWADVWREEHLAAFTVAKAVEQDVLEALRTAVQKAQDEGLSYAAFKRQVTPILADLGWWGRQDRTDPITGETKEVQLGSSRRLDIIIHTNMRTARAAGQWERIERAKKVLPFLVYRLGASERHRPHHEDQEGKIYRVDDPFWDYWMPPNGYGCNCYVEQVTGRDAERLGGESQPADLTLVDYRNKRTGQTVKSVRGVDPTFAYNPGKERMRGLKEALK